MRRRLYFVLPDVNSARQVMNALLLARIDDRHIHFYAQPDNLPADLPRANTVEKTDMLHGLVVGIALGAGLGLIAGLLALMFPPWYVPAYRGTILLITTIIGAIAGAAWTAMVSVALPNHKIEEFKPQLDRKQVLLMVMVPLHRVGQVRDLIHNKFPQAGYGGVWPPQHDGFP